jgi:hypothetical protein
VRGAKIALPPMSPQTKVHCTVEAPKELADAVRAIAREEGRTFSGQLRRAMAEHVELHRFERPERREADGDA